MAKAVLKAVDSDGNPTGEEQKLDELKPIPDDASDFAKLFKEPGLGDGITDSNFTSISIGKPKEFFRTHSDPAYRRRTEILRFKPPGVIEESYYLIDPAMAGVIDEARPCVLVTVIDRDGVPQLWPIGLPKEGGKDMKAWSSARAAAKIGFDKWVKILWAKNAFKTREALDGYAPDPDWSKLPSFLKLVELAFGRDGVIRTRDHTVYKICSGLRKGPPVTTAYSGWRDLPYREIWVVDSEYYPGRGLANGGRDGDAPTPLCVVAIECDRDVSSASGKTSSHRFRLTASIVRRCSLRT